MAQRTRQMTTGDHVWEGILAIATALAVVALTLWLVMLAVIVVS